jgi:hypothetical protein
VSQQKDGAPPSTRKLRSATRWPIEVPVTIADGLGKSIGKIMFDTRDLSVSGAFLKSASLLEIDEEIALEFKLDAGRSVRARAKVVRISRTPPGMGIVFTKLDDKDKDAIRRLVTQKGVESNR